MSIGKKTMRRDWGTISQVQKGAWRIRYWAQTDTGYRRCSETVRGTRKQAGERLAQLRLAHGHDAPCPTVGDCWEQWYCPDRERMVEQGDLAPLSLVQYKSTWKCHVSCRWSRIPADQVQPLDVQQWLLGMKRVAAESSLHLLRQILDYATRYGFISSNPLAVRYLLPSRQTTCQREDGIWTPQELGEVWHACWNSWFESAMLLAGFGGCRVGESLGVKSKDIRGESVNDVPLALVRIERQIDTQGKDHHRLKNRWSKRTALLAGRPALRLIGLARQREPEDYLSVPNGCINATQQLLRIEFAKALDAHGVPHHLFKNLRKTWQTNMRWILRLPPWAIEPMMGHVGNGVTGRHYDKPSEHEFALILSEAWRENPFADNYDWLD